METKGSISYRLSRTMIHICSWIIICNIQFWGTGQQTTASTFLRATFDIDTEHLKFFSKQGGKDVVVCRMLVILALMIFQEYCLFSGLRCTINSNLWGYFTFFHPRQLHSSFTIVCYLRDYKEDKTLRLFNWLFFFCFWSDHLMAPLHHARPGRKS